MLIPVLFSNVIFLIYIDCLGGENPILLKLHIQ